MSGLDGWGIIEPFLPAPLQRLGPARRADQPILILVAALFFVPGLSRWLWQTVFAACALIGLDARGGSLPACGCFSSAVAPRDPPYERAFVLCRFSPHLQRLLDAEYPRFSATPRWCGGAL